MEFLSHALHVNVKIEKNIGNFSLPVYLTSRYDINIAWIDQIKVFLLNLKTELEQVNIIKKHVKKIQTIEKLPVVLVLKTITARQRQKLIDACISFVVNDKQCYLPFLGTLLTERCDAEINEVNKLMPSSQMLLLYYISKNQKDIFSGEAVHALNVSAMTITRAVRQLESIGLIRTYKQGVMKVITSDYSGKELYEKAKKYFIDPINSVKYLNKEHIDNSLLFSGDSALAQYSMLNSPRINCYAVFISDKWKNLAEDELTDDSNQVELQLWKYDPKTLSNNSAVDKLSLALSYINDTDERIEETIEEMLDAYWEDINGTRN